MTTKQYYIAECYALVIANDDSSGLSFDDIELFYKFFESDAVPMDHYLVVKDKPTFWGKCAVTGLDGELITIEALPLNV